MIYYCPGCRAEVTAEAQFCKNCGLSHSDAQQQNHLLTQGHSLPTTPPIIAAIKPEEQVQKPKSHQFMRPMQFGERLPQQEQNSPLRNTPAAQYSIEIVKGRPALIDENEQFSTEDDNIESYIATSVAAEHWRTSWRNRQHNEAGPATLASRGQSVVQEPLMAMQQSLARMRAIIIPKKSRNNLSLWLILLLMFCLMGGLLAFIASTFQTHGEPVGQSVQQVNTLSPGLSVSGTQEATIAQGQTLPLHGAHFAANASILFLLDGTLPITDADKHELVTLASEQGSFDVSISIPTTWSAGTHVIYAVDSKDNLSAYLNIVVSLSGAVLTGSPDLALSTHSVAFHVVVGQDNPPEQFITLTNTNATAPIQWVARAVADDDLTWLDVDDMTTSGKLDIGGTETVGIHAIVDGLTDISKPYTGHIIFTINKHEQLTLPVELQLSGGTPEVAINPNPLVGVLSITGDSCRSGTTLLLTNLGNEPVNWSLSLDTNTATHIQFLYAGKPNVSGVLSSAGQQGDSKFLTMQCIHVKSGDTYQFTVHTGSVSWSAEVTIQAAP